MKNEKSQTIQAQKTPILDCPMTKPEMKPESLIFLDNHQLTIAPWVIAGYRVENIETHLSESACREFSSLQLFDDVLRVQYNLERKEARCTTCVGGDINYQLKMAIFTIPYWQLLLFMYWYQDWLIQHFFYLKIKK